jgi:hypothetical protein
MYVNTNGTDVDGNKMTVFGTIDGALADHIVREALKRGLTVDTRSEVGRFIDLKQKYPGLSNIIFDGVSMESKIHYAAEDQDKVYIYLTYVGVKI